MLFANKTFFIFSFYSKRHFLFFNFLQHPFIFHWCHLDSGIANISLDNFTGTISIITPISNDEDLMLSSPQTNGSGNLFNSDRQLTLITQPILGARSRKKPKIDSITNNHRNSYNDLLINRVKLS